MLKIEQHASLNALARAAVAAGDVLNVATFSEDADRNQRVAAHLNAARDGVSSRVTAMTARFNAIWNDGADLTNAQLDHIINEIGAINERRAAAAKYRKLHCIWLGKNRAAGPMRNLSGSFA